MNTATHKNNASLPGSNEAKTFKNPMALIEIRIGKARCVFMRANPIFDEVRFEGFIVAATQQDVFEMCGKIAAFIDRKHLGCYCPEWSKAKNGKDALGDFSFDVKPGWHPTARRMENHTDIKAQILLKLRKATKTI